MTVELFMTLLTVCAVVTSLIVEGLKRLEIFKSNNLCALVVSCLVGLFACVLAYMELGIPFTVLNTMYMFAFIVFNWLVATLGYDKVMQAVKQIIGG